MKQLLIVTIIAIVFSCKKENKICYVCEFATCGSVTRPPMTVCLKEWESINEWRANYKDENGNNCITRCDRK